MEPNQILRQIDEIMINDHSIQINQNNKNEIIMLLKQMYGKAHKDGMEEGAKVAIQFKKYKENMRD
ncbi:hypothetical protein [Aquibacillus rhizosphaerae]|uniref:Uncharacterized protein n=1 Tax=Aquibacillus rhizosphaerae TaxID=3051431 RepID=A0ABT7L1A8_9BACI|nr:hypothetical protein [Aquibacillus sp. LR5S19]MDL4839634.1 hypothetical protein [Aquibacillus sp. LR5S19]